MLKLNKIMFCRIGPRTGVVGADIVLCPRGGEERRENENENLKFQQKLHLVIFSLKKNIALAQPVGQQLTKTIKIVQFNILLNYCFTENTKS